MKRSIWTIIIIASISVPMWAQYNPHPEGIQYDENFRGQFHFSPKSGWMNDINGLVFSGGKYHMLYQWGQSVRHGGYATSEDLVRWTDRGIALIPRNTFLQGAKQNVSGDQIFSGSAVVVKGETAKRITGCSKEAIVAVYTGTTKGTCLAWTNDNGESWHDYPGNPVANPTITKHNYPRDPVVFYYEPSKKYILAIYENGTSFYGSEDLIEWEYLSNIDFGFECPDIYELPLDGDTNNKKWVLCDAKGSYLVGNFDGERFIPDGQKPLLMTCGPDFYAAQTFPAGGLADKNDDRIVQIAWMDRWNGGCGETVWKRNATFPVELGLVTRGGKMCVTRNPIEEIKSLYINTWKWEAQTLNEDNNLFKQNTKSSKSLRKRVFDLHAVFDLNGCEASRFGFQIANKTIAYNVDGGVLLDNKVLPGPDGKLEIRILVDWGQLEVFADGGAFSYSEEFAFSPDGKGKLSFFTDGPVSLVSMELNEIGSIWKQNSASTETKSN